MILLKVELRQLKKSEMDVPMSVAEYAASADDFVSGGQLHCGCGGPMVRCDNMGRVRCVSCVGGITLTPAQAARIAARAAQAAACGH